MEKRICLMYLNQVSATLRSGRVQTWTLPPVLNLAEAKSSVGRPEDSSRASCSRSHARKLSYTM